MFYNNNITIKCVCNFLCTNIAATATSSKCYINNTTSLGPCLLYQNYFLNDKSVIILKWWEYIKHESKHLILNKFTVMLLCVTHISYLHTPVVRYRRCTQGPSWHLSLVRHWRLSLEPYSSLSCGEFLCREHTWLLQIRSRSPADAPPAISSGQLTIGQVTFIIIIDKIIANELSTLYPFCFVCTSFDIRSIQCSHHWATSSANIE